MSFLWTVLTSSAVTAALLAGLAFLLRQVIATRLQASVQHEFDEKLANLNARLTTQNSTLTTLQSSVLNVVSGREALIVERQLEYTQRLWEAYLDIQYVIPLLNKLQYINLDELAVQLAAEPNTKAELKNFYGSLKSSIGNSSNRVNAGNAEKDKVRLFVDETAWRFVEAMVLMHNHEYVRVVAVGVAQDERDSTAPQRLVNSTFVMNKLKELLPQYSADLDAQGPRMFKAIADHIDSVIVGHMRATFTSGSVAQSVSDRLTAASAHLLMPQAEPEVPEAVRVALPRT